MALFEYVSDKKGVREFAYESSFASNVLYVRRGDMAAADFLAALPEVSLVYSPTSGTTPPTVYFTNTSQYAISPTWAFGDGSYGSRTISRTLTT